MNVDRQAVQRHRQLASWNSPFLLQLSFFRVFHWTRRLGNIGCPVDQRGKPYAGAAAGDLNVCARVLLHVGLSPLLPENHHRVRALDGNAAGLGKD